MNNPLSSDPRHALFPHPPGCTGWRIWSMLCDKLPDVTKSQYLRAFDRRNLLSTTEWSAGEARRVANNFVIEMEGREVVVFGAEPRRAVGLPEMLIHPLEWRSVKWRQLPHPSGRNRWYNDPECRALASNLLAELYSSVELKNYS